jgi:hypothetical protein
MKLRNASIPWDISLLVTANVILKPCPGTPQIFDNSVSGRPMYTIAKQEAKLHYLAFTTEETTEMGFRSFTKELLM